MSQGAMKNLDLSFDSKSQIQFFNESITDSKVMQNEELDGFIREWDQKYQMLESNLLEMKKVKEEVQEILNITQTKPITQNEQQNLKTTTKKQYEDKENYDPQQLNCLNKRNLWSLQLSKQGNDEMKDNKKPISQFLEEICLSQYIQNFLETGIYNNYDLKEQIQSCDKSILLTQYGIFKIGHQKLILAHLDEGLDLFHYLQISANQHEQDFYVGPNILKRKCHQFRNGFNRYSYSIQGFLQIGLISLYQRFIDLGFEQLDMLSLIMMSDYRITSQEMSFFGDDLNSSYSFLYEQINRSRLFAVNLSLSYNQNLEV